MGLNNGEEKFKSFGVGCVIFKLRIRMYPIIGRAYITNFNGLTLAEQFGSTPKKYLLEENVFSDHNTEIVHII